MVYDTEVLVEHSVLVFLRQIPEVVVIEYGVVELVGLVHLVEHIFWIEESH